MDCAACGNPLTPGLRMCARCGHRLTPAAPATAGAVPAAPPRAPAAAAAPAPATSGPYRLVYAGFWRRCAAFLIDLLVLLPVSYLSQRLLPIFGGVLIWWLYFALFDSSGWQATPGKRLLGLKVTDANGIHLHFGRASLRFVGRLLAAAPLLLGFVLVVLTPHRQGLHDLIASTIVIRARVD